MDNAQLLAMLTATVDRGAIDFDPSDTDGAYMDWSIQCPGGRRFEFGADGEAVSADLSWEQITRLQQALTVLLLERQGVR